MSSGAYGWYKQGEFDLVDRRQLLAMALCASGSTVFFSLLLLIAIDLIPSGLLLSTTKVASALVSFYVAKLLWNEIKTRKAHRVVAGRIGEDPEIWEIEKPARLDVDWRIYPWIGFGALLNVTTAVGIGELSFSHIMKYYSAPAKQAIAIGVLMQAISVISQSAIIVMLMAEYLIVPMACIGLLITMSGGRLAAYIMTRRFIEPS